MMALILSSLFLGVFSAMVALLVTVVRGNPTFKEFVWMWYLIYAAMISGYLFGRWVS
jgi:VIT1/CCC1 family predicted Fe2+/Mn2+ transporter